MIGKSILIVDDEFGLAEVLREMLIEYGYEVRLAINGGLAFALLNEQKVDLVLADLMMPVMDGVELATAIRNNDAYRDVSIVLMTSLPTATPEPGVLFNAVLRKPFSPTVLLNTIQKCLSEL